MSAGKTLQSLKTSIATVTDTWATAAGVQSPARSERLGRTLVGLSALLAVALTFFPLGSSLFVIPFAAFTVGAIGLLVPGVGRRRTLLGRDVWSKAGGFERLLSTDSAKDRFDFSGKRELYTAFIPFAVAFDCADRWARKYEKATGAEAPIPSWYGGGTSSGHALVLRRLRRLLLQLRVILVIVHLRLLRDPVVVLLRWRRRRWWRRRWRRRRWRRFLVSQYSSPIEERTP